MEPSTMIKRMVRNELNLYEDKYEIWKTDHQMAMLYFDMCDLVSEGLHLFDRINKLDESFRQENYQQPLSNAKDIDKAKAIDREIKLLYELWYDVSRKVQSELLPLVEPELGEVKDSERFASCCREVHGILTQDDEFFIDDALVGVRDEAIDQVMSKND